MSFSAGHARHRVPSDGGLRELREQRAAAYRREMFGEVDGVAHDGEVATVGRRQRQGIVSGFERWTRGLHWWALAAALMILLAVTCPSQSSFVAHVKARSSRVLGAGRGAIAYVEAAVGAQKYKRHLLLLFASARHGGELYVGAAGSWIRVPRSLRNLAPNDARGDVQLFCVVSILVWFLGWWSSGHHHGHGAFFFGLGPRVRREWMWRHFTVSPPASELIVKKPHALFASLVSHASASALACDLLLFLAAAPATQDAMGGDRVGAATMFLVGGAVANALGAAAHGLLLGNNNNYNRHTREDTAAAAERGTRRSYVPPPWASPHYVSGCGVGCCFLLGYLAAADAEVAMRLRRSLIGTLFSVVGGLGGGVGVAVRGGGGGGGSLVEYPVLGGVIRLTAAQLLFATLGLRAAGVGGALGGGGGGLTDLGVVVGAAGAALGAAAHRLFT